jgi:hypothetical protein
VNDAPPDICPIVLPITPPNPPAIVELQKAVEDVRAPTVIVPNAPPKAPAAAERAIVRPSAPELLAPTAPVIPPIAAPIHQGQFPVGSVRLTGLLLTYA